MMKTTMRVAIAVCLVAVVSACGGDDETADAEGSDGPETTTIRIDNPPNVSNVPLHIAIEQGYFEEEGLTIEAEVDLSAGSTIEALIGGEVEIAWTNVVSGMNAFGKGFDVRAVAVSDVGVSGSQQLVVPEGSSVQSIDDLDGSQIAVMSPQTICILALRSALEEQGEDPEAINFTPVSPPEHVNVLEAGEVDGSCISEPFKTLMVTELGAKPVFEVNDGAMVDYAVGAYVVSAEFAEDNPNTIAAFRRALRKATEYANANLEEVRAKLPDFAGVSPEIADVVAVNRFVEAGDTEEIIAQLQKQAELMIESDMLDNKIDVSQWFVPEAE